MEPRLLVPEIHPHARCLGSLDLTVCDNFGCVLLRPEVICHPAFYKAVVPIPLVALIPRLVNLILGLYLVFNRSESAFDFLYIFSVLVGVIVLALA